MIRKVPDGTECGERDEEGNSATEIANFISVKVTAAMSHFKETVGDMAW